ncbi:hypothetical protein RCH33_828 [Flavobacterium daejeonense]|nr:hypothetical protein RCH33_828 [Flavobacterium daejeonense]
MNKRFLLLFLKKKSLFFTFLFKKTKVVPISGMPIIGILSYCYLIIKGFWSLLA